jgi:hypothetical protein
MKITVTFDSLDEFEAFKGTAVVAPQSAQKPAEEPEAPKAKKSAPKEEMPWKEAPAEAETPKAAAAPAVTEDFRVEVRKALAQLNKATGGNVAKELIKEFGCSKLTEVKLEDLPALMEKVKARNAE